MMLYDNNRVLLKMISALHDQSENRKLAELIYRTFSRVNMDKVKNESKTYVTILKNMSDAIINSTVSLSEDELIEILEECKTRENVSHIQKARNTFEQHSSEKDIETIMTNCEVFNKSSILSEKANEFAELISASNSFVELPKNTKKFENLIIDVYHTLSSETVQKSHKELILLPGVSNQEHNPETDIVGLDDLHDDIQKESSIVVQTGIKGVDEVVLRGGLYSGKLTAIGSYAGGGKSILMVNILLAIATNYHNKHLYNLPEFKHKRLVVVIITYENTLLQTYRRIMKLSGLGKEYINSLSYSELKTLMQEMMSTAPIGIVIKAKDARTESAKEIVQYLKEIEEKYNVYIVAVGHDYINLTVPINVSKSNSEFMDAGQVAEELREYVCKGMNKPMISAIQVKREWEDKYVELVKKGEKLPIRCFTGGSIYGGNIIKQKVDNLIFVVYSVLNGSPYTEILLDKDRDGNANDANEAVQINENMQHMVKHLERQKTILDNLIDEEDKSVKEFYGSDGRLAIAIPRIGLSLSTKEYYADRFQINPEATKFMNMFQKGDEDEDVVTSLYKKDEDVEEFEKDVPFGDGKVHEEL